jgi:hypothetical protein
MNICAIPRQRVNDQEVLMDVSVKVGALPQPVVQHRQREWNAIDIAASCHPRSQNTVRKRTGLTTPIEFSRINPRKRGEKSGDDLGHIVRLPHPRWDADVNMAIIAIAGGKFKSLACLIVSGLRRATIR